MGAHLLPGVAEGGGSGAYWGALGATVTPLCSKAAARLLASHCHLGCGLMAMPSLLSFL